jgi:hypothetical protein
VESSRRTVCSSNSGNDESRDCCTGGGAAVPSKSHLIHIPHGLGLGGQLNSESDSISDP